MLLCVSRAMKLISPQNCLTIVPRPLSPSTTTTTTATTIVVKLKLNDQLCASENDHKLIKIWLISASRDKYCPWKWPIKSKKLKMFIVAPVGRLLVTANGARKLSQVAHVSPSHSI